MSGRSTSSPQTLPVVSEEEADERIISTLLKAYKPVVRIGQGSYSRVYKGRCPSSSNVVAPKVMINDGSKGGSIVAKSAAYEVMTYKALQQDAKCNNIVAFYGHDPIILDGALRTVVLVLEYGGISLRDYMQRRRALEIKASISSCFLDLADIQSLMQQVLEGEAFCHSRNIMHRDLKPENLLIDTTGPSLILKITDWGMAQLIEAKGPEEYPREVTTLPYRALELPPNEDAPERVQSKQIQYDAKVDVWSSGCIFAEMHTGEMLFPVTEGNEPLSERHTSIRNSLAHLSSNTMIARSLAD
ncbi:kinase-like domain-containing protein [Trametes meyenii]|nr:kinase-like domain-containing protein [Trametes meyenii]